jgi:predicted PolB exonuclease-like 3'-5' exonuclease
MTIAVFDIETIPDIEGGRRLYKLQGLSDKDVANVMFHKRRQESGGSDFLRHHLQRIVSISVVLRDRYQDSLSVYSLGSESSTEKELLQQFFQLIDRYTPTLVSWNGSGFDLPVLNYRAMANSVAAPRYWEMGEGDNSFKWNNYHSRYHWRHTDLMDVLAGFSGRANAPLDEMASLCGFPGKLGMSGDKVWDCYRTGDIQTIRNYCETDVLNTYLLYIRFQLLNGQLNDNEYEAECELLRGQLQQQQDKTHFQEFLAAWPQQS